MARAIVNLGAATVRCPHCGGDGIIEIGDVSVAGPTGHYTEAQAKVCMVCVEDRGDWQRGRGWIELPLTDAQVELIREQGCLCCEQLADEAPVWSRPRPSTRGGWDATAELGALRFSGHGGTSDQAVADLRAHMRAHLVAFAESEAA